jgi:NAD(P)-dependent dehydrogenase (short-subunit alcohol dehydrogenase family)
VKRFEGRVALVTGGGSGIGRATAERLAADGAAVMIANRGEEAGRDVVAAIGAAGGTARYAGVDVADEASVISMFDALGAAFGPELHVLVNSAGTVATTTTPDTSLEEWERVFAVNARGTFLCCKYGIGRMRAPHASIVNVGSVAGLVGVPNRAAYCASKGAVIAFSRAMAIDHVREGIRVNCVCPGTIDSPWIERLVADGASRDDLVARQPIGRLGTPEEVAEAILYLASDQAAFSTGSSLVVDGGMSAG